MKLNLLDIFSYLHYLPKYQCDQTVTWLMIPPVCNLHPYLNQPLSSTPAEKLKVRPI